MPSEQVPPVSFDVVLKAGGGVSGPARLLVEPGAITCVPAFFLGSERVAGTWAHTEPEVEMYVARAVPPWRGLALPLGDGERTFTVTTWRRHRPVLARALSAAGFSVVERRTWLHRPAPGL